MGFFSKLRNPTAAPTAHMALAKAVLVPSAMTMMSDGGIDDVELIQLSHLCGFSPIFAQIPPETTMVMLKEILDEMSTGDVQRVADQAKKELSQPMRETALLFAVRIAMADGHVDEREARSLVALARHFGVPESGLQVMFDIMAILQRAPQKS